MPAALAFALLLQAAPAVAAPPRTPAFERPETATGGPALTVACPTLVGGYFRLAQSGYGRNYAPAMTWSAGPAATRSYALIVEDVDAGDGPRPLLHWLAYDIPSDLTELKARTHNLDRVVLQGDKADKEGDDDAPAAPAAKRSRHHAAATGPSFSQGPNDHGGLGWTGPHPPVGDPAHHYHLQVFALDRKSLGRPGLDRDAVLAAMKGHVVAKGEIVALYAQEPDKVRKPKKGDAPAAPQADQP